ncbi:hypothetical protein TPA0905_50970 [Streptomyces olivaceus]|nr:hypothetical protein TPA0905_50970 [Streptomyces olivaceus]
MKDCHARDPLASRTRSDTPRRHAAGGRRRGIGAASSGGGAVAWWWSSVRTGAPCMHVSCTTRTVGEVLPAEEEGSPARGTVRALAA